jgi:hypothetical protein
MHDKQQYHSHIRRETWSANVSALWLRLPKNLFCGLNRASSLLRHRPGERDCKRHLAQVSVPVENSPVSAD